MAQPHAKSTMKHGAVFLAEKGRRARKPPKQVDPSNPEHQPPAATGGTSDAYTPGPLQSVWQTTEITGFFQEAEQREKDFAATRDVRLVTKNKHAPIGTEVVHTTLVKIGSDQRPSHEYFDLSEKYLRIPRRPPWDYSLSKESVDLRERESFLRWRRELSEIEQQTKAAISPYEKNIEVWRQLWRVVERSDVLLQIVDARNPLVFRSVDFERCVAEHKKKCILVLNKCDLLTDKQREEWTTYLNSIGITFLFFSALEGIDEAAAAMKAKKIAEEEGEETPEAEQVPMTSHQRHLAERKDKRLKGQIPTANLKSVPEWVSHATEAGAYMPKIDRKSLRPKRVDTHSAPPTQTETARDERIAKAFKEGRGTKVFSTSRVFHATELLDALVAMRSVIMTGEQQKPEAKDNKITVGMVGYPNVGKSSTINALLGTKKVVMSATPGKTKMLQTLTLPLERRIVLCDCPGLVFPSFSTTTEDMVCDGILPIAHMKDFVLPTMTVCRRISRLVLEARYNISLRREDDMDDSPHHADRLLNALARLRGYIEKGNRPVRSRASLLVLREFVAGKLVFVHPPPTFKTTGGQENGDDGNEEDEDWDDVDDDGSDDNVVQQNEDEAAYDLADSNSDSLSDSAEEAAHLRKFFAPVEVNFRWAKELRRAEEEFNVGVNDHIVAQRNAAIDRKAQRKEAQANALVHNRGQQARNEGDMFVEDADGELALAVNREDGIVVEEVAPPAGEGDDEEGETMSKRQARRLQKKGLLFGRKQKVEGYH